MGTSYERGTAFMGEGTEFLHCAPQNSGASLRRQTFVCVVSMVKCSIAYLLC